MNELKFNSQVCTTKEQSQRLLDIGLKPETADMVLFKSYDLPKYPFDYIFNQDPNSLVNCSYVPMVKGNTPFIQDGNIPAWSLHRLIEIAMKGDKLGCITHNIHQNNVSSYYELVIASIEHLIKIDEFNKEYLKQ